MNAKLLVKISNIIGLVSIVLLVYWVFTFIVIQVFGLKVFREHMTQTFFMSILGILALMGGALMLNIMFNLTRIAERGLEPQSASHTQKIMFTLIGIFPVILAILFGGDYLSSQKKQDMFISSAENMLQSQTSRAQQLSQYQFNEKYIIDASNNLDFLSLLDPSFNQVQVIIPDQIQNNKIYLSFSKHPQYQDNLAANPRLEADQAIITADPAVEAAASANAAVELLNHKAQISLDKKDYVKRLSLDEKNYLNTVFNENAHAPLFKAQDGFYELYYPYTFNHKTVVLYFSDRQGYGKLGS